MISARARFRFQASACCILLALVAQTARAQDPLRTLPENYRLAFENDTVRVIHVLYRPHEKLPVHDHPKTPTIYVYLTFVKSRVFARLQCEISPTAGGGNPYATLKI